MRTKVALTESVSTIMQERMSEVEANRVSTVLAQIKKAHDARKAVEAAEGEISKDFRFIENMVQDETVARFFVATGVNPTYYINSAAYDADTFATRSGIPSEAKTRSLKAYKKFRETAHFFGRGDKLEGVLITFVACAILSAQHTRVIPRDVCTKFLSNIPLNHVSDELREAVEKIQASQMSGGADTQTSQCTLTLANMRAAQVVRNGRNKDFAIDPNSPVMVSFAQRFNMVSQLERAQRLAAEQQVA